MLCVLIRIDSFRQADQSNTDFSRRRGGLVVERQTPEREVGGCILEQDTFTSQKYW